jgi:hypothetical protein
MPQLTVRNLPKELVRALRIQANRNDPTVQHSFGNCVVRGDHCNGYSLIFR